MSTDDKLLPMSEVEGKLREAGIDRIETLHGSTYLDNRTIIICPTRGAIHHRVVSSWQNLIAPMNQPRAFLFAAGMEVGQAYNEMIRNVLGHHELSKFPFIMCVEDDNLLPPDAHVRLLEAMRELPEADGVGGLYWTKGEHGLPLALGDPARRFVDGKIDFVPIDLRPALEQGQRFVEVNGLPQGCTLFRTELFRYVPEPWFNTFADIMPAGGAAAYTQDMKFAENARRLGRRFFLDLRVRVGHLDTGSGIVY